MTMLFKMTLALSLLGTAAFAADSPKQVLDRHVAAIQKGDVDALMADYADNAIVLAPKGIVTPATHTTDGPDVFVGKKNARKLFVTLTNKDNIAGVRSMKSHYENLSGGVTLMHWVQFPGTAKEVDGVDVFVIRGGKVAYQAVTVDPPKK